MSRPQVSKRDRQIQRCPDCGQKIINPGAHYEACLGFRSRQAQYPTRGRCESRILTGHGLWTYCVRPWNHRGEHIYR